jgi:hypothetical protein
VVDKWWISSRNNAQKASSSIILRKKPAEGLANAYIHFATKSYPQVIHHLSTKLSTTPFSQKPL